MKKILTIMAAMCAIACSNKETRIYDFTAKFMDGMLSRQDPDYASNPDIKWNFTKFLIDRKGRVVARFEPMVTPAELTAAVEEQL